ncbi:MAG: prepilin-type N-terminal cleavage/methylation domain-containing protein [Gemmataceae bacterium]
MIVQPRNGSTRKGFSLLELVVVLVILAIVAGMVVSIVDWLRRSANYGVASNNQGALLHNLQLYRTTFGNGMYPDRFDSLLGADGQPSIWLHSELVGKIAAGSLNGEEFASLDRSGIKTVMDHADTLNGVVQQSPQNSGNIPRVLNASSEVALLNTSNAVVQAEIIGTIYPTGIPSDVRLVLFGVGPANEANGRTLNAPPLYTELDPAKTYGRFVVLVETYNPRAGRRAQIKAVLDPKGRMLYRQLSEFWQSMNNQ